MNRFDELLNKNDLRSTIAVSIISFVSGVVLWGLIFGVMYVARFF